MYERFFHLKTKPFELVPNPAFIYLSKTHKKAITYLDYGVREKAGFILLTGEVGSGKTTLIRNLVKKMGNNVVLSKVFNTKVDFEQLISMINDDFGLNIKDKNKVRLLKDLYDFLIEQHSKGSHCILIIDEAQNLTPELLEEIRMLSNLETDDSKLLQIILVGQPELKKTLSMPELRQFRQRISVSCHLYPFKRHETGEYIYHRLEVAGNKEAIKFKGHAVDVIHHYSRGIPRLVNIICDFLMLSAFAEEKNEADEHMVFDIVKDLEIDVQHRGIKTFPDNQQENIVCPKCGFKQSAQLSSGQQRAVCLKCGIVFAKFNACCMPWSDGSANVKSPEFPVKDLEFYVQHREVKPVPDDQQENIVCPKCGFKQSAQLSSGQQRAVCLKCGIVFAKFAAHCIPVSEGSANVKGPEFPVKDLEFDVQHRGIKTFPDNQQENIVCPKCGFKQLVRLDSGQERAECLKCGIVFAKFAARHMPLSSEKSLEFFKRRAQEK